MPTYGIPPTASVLHIPYRRSGDRAFAFTERSRTHAPALPTHDESYVAEPTEGYHFGVNALAQNVRFALYPDFADPQRQRGAERF
jgi:hypothetical protein